MKTKKQTKKLYEKPALRVLNIASSVQTLATGCKTAAMSGPVQAQCLPSGGTPCSALGS